jgi:hypothetical protein
MFTRNVILTVAAMFTPMLAAAATYDAGSLNFSTETRQNVWAPGDALEKSGNKFVGETWNTGTPDFGLIVGEASKKIRSPTYDTDLAAWNFCGTITIGGVCGLPKPQEFITTVDTRTGFVASIDSTGKAGFDIDYKLSAGSFGASLDYGVSAVLPDTVKKGEAFQIAANSIFSDGTIDVQAPTIEASIAAVLKVKADAKGTGCFIAFGCSTSTTNLATFDIDAELISVDPSEISYLKGLLPPGVSLSTPLLKQTVATLKAGIVNGVPAVYAEGIGIPPVGATAGIDLGSISVEPPKFDDPEDVGKKIGDSLLANATGEFLEMNADLDGLLPVPKGGASAALGPIDLSFDLFDFDAGPSLDVFQDLNLTP